MAGLAPTRMLTVAVAAELVYQLFGSNMSSPQTGELNANARAPTIDKWVNLTNAECVAWVAFLCYLDKSLWPALGGGIAGGSMYFKYRYAIKSGLASNEPPTEDYQNPERVYSGDQVYSQA
jgi:hypothetical protein